MVCPEPCLNAVAKHLGKIAHFASFRIGNRVRPLVVREVPLLAKDVELPDGGCFEAEREFQRLNDAIVMVPPLGFIPGGGQRRGCELEGRVIRDGELPIGNQCRCLAGFQIPIRDGEQVSDLLWARLVLLEPSEFEPIWQAHARHRSGRFSGQPPHWKGSDGLQQAYGGTRRSDKPKG